MPFTPAHPAITLVAKILPRRYISWTALFIGSMVPDMEYFIFMNPGSRMSHTLYGIVNFNLPMTFLIAMVWHTYTGPLIMRALPFVRKEFSATHGDFAGWLSKHWLIFTVSALLGICSHIFLDGFCHARGFMVKKIPWLLEVVNLGGFQMRRCYMLWYLSSVIGLFIMFFFITDFRKIVSPASWKQAFQHKYFWLKVVIGMLVISGMRIIAGLSWNVIRHLVVIAIGAFLYSVVIVSVIENIRLRKNQGL
jgi:hypothetical protein